MLGCRLHPSWTVVSDGGLRWKRRPWSPRGGSLSLTAACRTTITNPGLRATSEVARNEDRDHRGNRPDRLEDRPHSASGRPRGRRRLAQYRRQHHHRHPRCVAFSVPPYPHCDGSAGEGSAGESHVAHVEGSAGETREGSSDDHGGVPARLVGPYPSPPSMKGPTMFMSLAGTPARPSRQNSSWC